LREKLGASWAETFYREVFCRIDEEIFVDLYIPTAVGTRVRTCR
jgi:hypothetical protein